MLPKWKPLEEKEKQQEKVQTFILNIEKEEPLKCKMSIIL